MVCQYLLSFKYIVLDYFTLMSVLAEVHVFPVCIVILCSKVIFSLCLCIFYSGISEATQLEGKLAANASCIREGSIKLACHHPYH